MALAETEQKNEQKAFPLGIRNLVKAEGWGMSSSALSYLYQPTSVEEIFDVFELAKKHQKTIAFRGGGRSYGDAAINDDGLILDLTNMNKILDWNPETGIVDLEPGVSIEKLWKSTIIDGWWPPVVSGTMFTTMGGCAAMNIHGKNNFKAGTFGEHILEFDFMTPKGEQFTVSKDSDPELFHAAISGFGMLGCFTRIRLQMKRVYSGKLWVEAFTTHSIENMMNEIQMRIPKSDYLVGWVDCIAGGSQLGRGIVHQAGYLNEGIDDNPQESLQVCNQELPDKLLGVVPKSLMHLPLSYFVNNLGMRCVNLGKFRSSVLQPRGHRYYQSHAGFAFLLDYVPNWKWSYKPGGLIQYQVFVPKESAADVFNEIIHRSQKKKMPSYLGVLKRHRPDDFLMSHAVDGYSLALDYRVTKKNREALWKMCQEFEEIVLDHGGKYYFAKDSTLTSENAKKVYGENAVTKLFELKKKYDPDFILQTNLSRRVFAEYFDSSVG